jgi:hypothetical protein
MPPVPSRSFGLLELCVRPGFRLTDAKTPRTGLQPDPEDAKFLVLNPYFFLH